MNRQCISYVTDTQYFFPTAVSAMQARNNARSTTDIAIVLTENIKNMGAARKFCGQHGIKLINATELIARKFAKLDKASFAGRVSMSAMGRLLLSEILPRQYETIIYIDGDTQISGSLAELEDMRVAPGKILAALDYVSILDRLNGLEQSVVFNSGVLKFDRRQWIGPAAFDYYADHGGELHDQGALNAVAGDALVLISSKWNFPKQFLHLLGPERPTITHFMAHPKPWDGRFFPWTRKEADVYRQALRENPCLRPFVTKISPLRRIVYWLRSARDEAAFRLKLRGFAWPRNKVQSVLMQ